MPALGLTELLIILLIVVVLFGASRIGGIVSGLGQGIREFRRAVKDDVMDRASPATGGEAFCRSCGSRRSAQQRFCVTCGAALESPLS